jgi:hypothetical protein
LYAQEAVMKKTELLSTTVGSSHAGLFDVVCLNCHGNHNMKWAAEKAEGTHSYGK